MQSSLMRTRHHTILVDTCVGDHKKRQRPSWNMTTSGKFLADLAATGGHPDAVDYVLCTHVQVDHVGWNTQRRDGRWVPTTFPKRIGKTNGLVAPPPRERPGARRRAAWSGLDRPRRMGEGSAAGGLIVVFLGIVVAIMLGGVLYLTSSIVLPFMVALFLAYLLDPLVRFLQHFRVPLALAVCFALLVTFIFLALMGMLFYASAQSFVREYPTYEPKLRALVTTLTSRLEVASLSWQISDLSQELSSASMARAALASVGTFVTFLGHLLLVLLFMVFILLGQQRLPQRLHRAFGEAQAQRMTRQVQTYLGTKALLSLVTGVLVNLCLLVLQVDFAVLWGALAFMLNFIPHVGMPIATIPPVLVAILKFDTLMPAIWIVVFVILIHVVLGGFVEPRMMGRSLHISPLLIVLSLLFWGWLWGGVGAVLAVPIMATIKIVCENILPLRFLSALMSEA